MTDFARGQELATALDELRSRIARACVAAGRTPDEVELLPVTKERSAHDVALLADLGLRAFGENRVQEAGPKVAEVAGLRPGLALRWHLVGRLQRNKARAALKWADRIESIDSPRLVRAVDAAARRATDEGRRSEPLSVLVQLSIDGDPDRGGVPRDGLLPLAELVAGCAGLRLDGLMAVAPMGADPDAAFAAVADAAALLRRRHPDAAVVSAGMSDDLEPAVRHGSTCVRVGTALLGPRRLTSGKAAGDQGG